MQETTSAGLSQSNNVQTCIKAIRRINKWGDASTKDPVRSINHKYTNKYRLVFFIYDFDIHEDMFISDHEYRQEIMKSLEAGLKSGRGSGSSGYFLAVFGIGLMGWGLPVLIAGSSILSIIGGAVLLGLAVAAIAGGAYVSWRHGKSGEDVASAFALLKNTVNAMNLEVSNEPQLPPEARGAGHARASIQPSQAATLLPQALETTGAQANTLSSQTAALGSGAVQVAHTAALEGLQPTVDLSNGVESSIVDNVGAKQSQGVGRSSTSTE
jgi:hypothetical protein